MKIKTFTTMDYNEFDELAAKLGLDFNFCAEQEASNDSEYSFNVDDRDLAAYKPEHLKLPYLSAHTVLVALVAKGLLNKGDFLVEVSW